VLNVVGGLVNKLLGLSFLMTVLVSAMTCVANKGPVAKYDENAINEITGLAIKVGNGRCEIENIMCARKEEERKELQKLQEDQQANQDRLLLLLKPYVKGSITWGKVEKLFNAEYIVSRCKSGSREVIVHEDGSQIVYSCEDSETGFAAAKLNLIRELGNVVQANGFTFICGAGANSSWARELAGVKEGEVAEVAACKSDKEEVMPVKESNFTAPVAVDGQDGSSSYSDSEAEYWRLVRP